MASAITHFIVGVAAGLPAMEAASLRGVMPRWAIPVSAGLFAVAPDLDTYAMFAFDIPRGSLFSHRGFFHSPCFLALLAFGVARFAGGAKAWITLGAVWTCAAVTHPLLDMLTDGGSGVMLFFPFTTGRLFFPWRPIRVSPLGIARFFDRAAEILLSELPFCIGALTVGWISLGLAARARCYPGSDR
jgi:inner membrane protein